MPQQNPKAEFKAAPVMQVGKYKGVAADKLPLSYCRWMLTQKFPEDVMRIVRKKVEASPLKEKGVSVSMHAVDKFSLLYLDRWLSDGKPAGIGIGEYVVSLAYQAMTLGKQLSQVDRHQDDARRYEYDGIVFAIAGQPHLPQYRELVTLFPSKRA